MYQYLIFLIQAAKYNRNPSHVELGVVLKELSSCIHLPGGRMADPREGSLAGSYLGQMDRSAELTCRGPTGSKTMQSKVTRHEELSEVIPDSLAQQD